MLAYGMLPYVMLAYDMLPYAMLPLLMLTPGGAQEDAGEEAADDPGPPPQEVQVRGTVQQAYQGNPLPPGYRGNVGLFKNIFFIKIQKPLTNLDHPCH